MYYILKEDKTYKLCNPEDWANQFKTINRRVDEDIVNNCFISTVWLGLDHNNFGRKPLVFETMVFDEKNDDVYCERYTSWNEAVEGHKKAVQWVLDGCKERD